MLGTIASRSIDAYGHAIACAFPMAAMTTDVGVMVADRLTRSSALVADSTERVTARAELSRGERVVFVAR